MWFDAYVHIIDKIPKIIPRMLPSAGSFPLYKLLDSGINSPETIYNIAPAANARHIAIIVWEIPPIRAPKNAPKPVVMPDNITYSITFDGLIPPFFMGTAIDIPSGISCKAIAIANEYPKETEASKPEPIANPSGKLCIAKPILTIIPVFNNVLLFLLNDCLFENIFPTISSHIIISIIPAIIPIMTLNIFDIPNASGINSKHTIAVINPDANDKIKLKNKFDFFLKVIPIIPPNVVPKVPKNNPIKVVFIKFCSIHYLV